MIAVLAVFWPFPRPKSILGMRYRTKPVSFTSLVKTTFYSLYKVFIAAVILLVFFTHLPTWFDSQVGQITAPKVYLAFLLAPLPYVLRDRFSVLDIVRHPYILWCALVLLMHFSGFLRAEHFGGTVEESAIQIDRMQKFLIAPAAAYLVYSISHNTFKPFLSILILAAPLMLLYGFVDPTFFHSKVDSNVDVIGRSGGTWFNPNIAGEAVLLGLVMARNWVPRLIFIVAFVLSGFAVMATGSRAAMIGWLLLSLYCMKAGNLPKLFMAIPVLLAVFYSSILLLVEDIISSIPEQAAGAENLLARLQFMSGSVDLADGGGDERSVLLFDAISEALQRPLVGHGHDFTSAFQSGAGSHNFLIQLWHMHGLLGVLAVVMLAFLLYRYATGTRFANLSLFAFGWFVLFSHNIIEYNLWLVFFAMSIFEMHKSKRVDVINAARKHHNQKKAPSKRSSRRSKSKSSTKRKYSW